MSKRSSLGIMSAMAMMMSAGYMAGIERPSRREAPEKSEKSVREEKKRREEKEVENAIKNGLKAFVYGNTTIYALNQKTADKKAKKLGLI